MGKTVSVLEFYFLTLICIAVPKVMGKMYNPPRIKNTCHFIAFDVRKFLKKEHFFSIIFRFTVRILFQTSE